MNDDRRIWVTVVAAAIVVGAVLVTSQIVRDGPVLKGSTESYSCRGGDRVAKPEWDGDELPAGAVAVRLCQGNSAAGPHFLDPLDELTTDVGALVALINRQPATEPSTMCNGDGGIGYTLLFSYPDETALAVAGEMYGCRHLTVGGSDDWRLNPEEIWEEFLRLLRAQRAASEPPAPRSLLERSAAEACGKDPGTPLVSAFEMTSAVLCVRSNNPKIAGHRVLTAADLAVLTKGLEVDAGRSASDRAGV